MKIPVICLFCLSELTVNWVLPWQMSPFLKPSRVLVWPMRVVIMIRFLRPSFGHRFTGKIELIASMAVVGCEVTPIQD